MTLVITIFYTLSVFTLVALHKFEIFLIKLFLYNTTLEVYRDSGKGKVIAESVITTTPIRFISQDIVNSQCIISLCKQYKSCWKTKYVHRGHTCEQIS